MNNLFKTDCFIKKKPITLTPILNELKNDIMIKHNLSDCYKSEENNFDLTNFQQSFGTNTSTEVVTHQHKLENVKLTEKIEQMSKKSVKDNHLNLILQNQDFILDIVLELRIFDEKNGTNLFENINYTNLRKFISQSL